MPSILQSRLLTHLIAVAAGALLVFAFAPFHHWPLAFVAPAVLMGLWVFTRSRWAFSIGYAFGLGFFGVGVSWVFYSVYEFGQAPLPFALLLTAAFVLVMALYPALLGLLQRRAPRCCLGWRLVVLIPAGWILLEWLRGWLFTGFPWLQLGYSQLTPEGKTAFAAVAPVAGALGVGYLVLLTVGLFLTLILERGRARWLSIAVSILLAATVFILGQKHWSAPVGEPIRVALVQGNIAQENKWEADWLLPTVERYQRLTDEHLDADLIIWPEVALPGTVRLFREYVFEPLARQLQARGSELLTGILYEGRDGRVYNALIEVGGDHEMYFKRHLVPFGEFIPLRDWMPWLDRLVLVATEDLYPGQEATLIHAAGQAIGSSICYEDAFGEEMADFLPEATLLVNVSNDAWFGPTLAPAQHLQIARMRALELGRPLLRATNTGITAIIAADGTVIARAPTNETTVLTGQVSGHMGYTPFARWRNTPLLLVVVSLLSIAWLAMNKQEKSR